jgi:hypothetical protein
MQYSQQEFDKAVYLIRQSLDAGNEREMYLVACIVYVARRVMTEFGWAP